MWAKESGVSPPPGSSTLRIPFRLPLPNNLPPSCKIEPYSEKGAVGYYIEAVGKRPGLRFNKKSTIPFAVLPSHSSGAQLKEVLQQGWRGGWKSVQEQKEIRRGIWGEHSHVQMIVRKPSLSPAIPLISLCRSSRSQTSSSSRSSPRSRSRSTSSPSRSTCIWTTRRRTSPSSLPHPRNRPKFTSSLSATCFSPRTSGPRRVRASRCSTSADSDRTCLWRSMDGCRCRRRRRYGCRRRVTRGRGSRRL